jgi:hypothetical protein
MKPALKVQICTGYLYLKITAIVVLVLHFDIPYVI